ncbi:hypothetical protein [Microcystis aeruginosa]|nr:hypothetical protein [Microcystis aeruginosa]
MSFQLSVHCLLTTEKSFSPHPTPYTLHPTPYTLHPNSLLGAIAKFC